MWHHGLALLEFHVPVLSWALIANFPTIFFYWKFYKTSASTVSQEIGLHFDIDASFMDSFLLYSFLVNDKVTWFYKYGLIYRQ